MGKCSRCHHTKNHGNQQAETMRQAVYVFRHEGKPGAYADRRSSQRRQSACTRRQVGAVMRAHTDTAWYVHT